MSTSLEDRVVVVTGASAGIGAALALELAARRARVVLVARRTEPLSALQDKIGPSAFAIVADVTKREDHARIVQATLAHFGHIDAWVNNAGQGISRKATELTDEDIDTMMLVNVKSALYGLQAVLPHFRERKIGHVINVSSLLGRVPLATIRSAYSASKHALNALSANLRMELAPENILVSVVHPGVVATEFGVNARHGGGDSRQMPGAQSAEEVAKVIADVIEQRKADVYTREGARQMIASYYAAEDMAEAESKPPFFR
jgi:NADP-dependent 3-hydroxy acid dehydrogenase YdfG